MNPTLKWIGAALTILTQSALTSFGQSACQDSTVSFWVRNMHEHVTSFDDLGLYAIGRYGEPLNCEGSVTTTYDGNEFGRLRLDFAGGAKFQIETMPPEASVATLSDSTGLGDEARVREVLERYTDDIGLSIDWAKPTLNTTADEHTEMYSDPDDGLNASARLIFLDSLLISVRVSLAL